MTKVHLTHRTPSRVGRAHHSYCSEQLGGHGPPYTPRNAYRHRGAGYLLVLGAAMLLTVIGYASIMTARINTRMVTGTNDWAKAGELAIAGAEMAPVLFGDNSYWKSSPVSGVPRSFAVGQDQITIVLVDEDDNDFTTGVGKPIRAYGIGRVGDAVRARSVLLESNAATPMSCLEVSVHCVGNYSALGGTLTSDQTVSTSASITGLLAAINADVEYEGSVTGVTINGTKTKVSTTRTVPDPSTVFDYYIQNGTVIPLNALPVVNGDPTINGTVLTPTFNPYGSGTNAEGIYVVDCAGDVVDVKNSRIEGTLVLLNAQTNDLLNHCQILGNVNWQPAIPNYPAVLVQGNLDLGFTGGVTMAESDLGVNLNPIGAPYQGEEDASLDDSYPSRVQGLVYASSGADFGSSNPYIEGLLISGDTLGSSLGGDAAIRYRDRCYSEPPPGFGTGPYEPTVGTWRWDTPPCGTTNEACTVDADCCSNDCNLKSGSCLP